MVMDSFGLVVLQVVIKSGVTVTVRFCVMAALPELSVTSYCMVYVPMVVAFTAPVTVTFPVISLS